MADIQLDNPSPGVLEILEKHCSDEEIRGVIASTLVEVGVSQVLGLSAMAEDDVKEVRKKVVAKKDAYKERVIFINTCLRNAVREASFQADLARATDKIVTQKEACLNQKSALVSKLRLKVDALKSAFAVKDMGTNIMPPLSVWKKVSTNLASYVDFNTELRSTSYSDSVLSGQDTGLSLLLQSDGDGLSTVVGHSPSPQPAKNKEMSGSAWSTCFIKYSAALLLADVREGEAAKPPVNIDMFTLWSYMMSINATAARYGWSVAYEVDCAFRKHVEARCLEAAVTLRDALADSLRLAQITVDKTLVSRQSPAASSSASSTTQIPTAVQPADNGGKGGKKGPKRSREGKPMNNLCYEFLAKGVCTRPNCRFRHEKLSGGDVNKRQKTQGKK